MTDEPTVDDPYVAQDALTASEAKEESFRFPLRGFLAIANADRRDVVSHSDRVRFGAIGFFIIVFVVYAYFGWLAFVMALGLDNLGGETVGIIVASSIAIAAGTSVAMFDRTIVGQVPADLDYAPTVIALDEAGDKVVPRVQDDANRAARPTFTVGEIVFPSLVLPAPKRVMVMRVALAFIIAYFATQALDLHLFKGEIIEQQAKERKEALEDQIAAVDAENQKQRTSWQDDLDRQQDLQAEYLAQERAAKRYKVRKTCDGDRCRDARAKRLEAEAAIARLNGNNPALGGSPAYIAWQNDRRPLDEERERLEKDPSTYEPPTEGPLKSTAALFSYMNDNKPAFLIYLAALILALALDLAAILIKSSGRAKLYERRQALRDWSGWARTQIEARAALEKSARRRAIEKRTIEYEMAAQLDEAATLAALAAALQQERRDAVAAAKADGKFRDDADEWAFNAARDWVGVDEERAAGSRARDDGDTEPIHEREQERERVEFKTGSEIPERNPRWRLVRQLEKSQSGAHSIMWQGVDLQTDDPVAIKVMRAARRKTVDQNIEYQRALNERKWLTKLDGNPNVVQLLGDGKVGDHDFCVMPWASEGSLASYYDRAHRGTRPLREVLMFITMAVRGLGSQMPSAIEVVHRDIKPANILTGGGSAMNTTMRDVWLADWGLALHPGSTPATDFLALATPAYAAPDALDPRMPPHILDDLYSLGLVLWWCITGENAGWGEFAAAGHRYNRNDPVGSLAPLFVIRDHLAPLYRDIPDVPVYVAEFAANAIKSSRDDRIGLSEEDASHNVVLTWMDDRLREMSNRLHTQEQRSAGQPVLVGPEQLRRGTGYEQSPPPPRSDGYSRTAEVSQLGPLGSSTQPYDPTGMREPTESARDSSRFRQRRDEPPRQGPRSLDSWLDEHNGTGHERTADA